MLAGAGSGLGALPDLVLWSGTDRSPTGLHAEPPWWWAGVDLGLVSPARFERLRQQQIKGVVARVFLPAGRGGGEEGGSASMPSRVVLSVVVRVPGRSSCSSSHPYSDGNGIWPAGGRLMEVWWWILSSLSGFVARVGIELKRQAVAAGFCGHIFSDFACNLCKPSELISFFSHCGCESIPRQWQFTAKRKISRYVLAYDRFSLGHNDFMFGFITTKWTPVCMVNHLRRTRSQCLLKIKEMVRISLKTGYYSMVYYQAVEHSVFAFFVSLGCIRQRQLRESLMSLPRFGGEDFFDLSSVIRPQEL
jgi:hypothetical protein